MSSRPRRFRSRPRTPKPPSRYSEREAEEIGPALVPGTQAADSADPADYSVTDDDVVLVQAAETLGHYAEWLDVRASQLRQLNRCRSRRRSSSAAR